MSGPEVCPHLVPADRECEECSEQHRDDQLQSALSRAAQAEAEVVELRRVLEVAEGHMEEMGSAGSGGGYSAAVKDEILSALSSPSPVAEALGRLVEAAERLHQHRNWQPRFEGDIPDPPGVLSMAIDGVGGCRGRPPGRSGRAG